ncbi:hypothetical protein NQ317_013078 [Molorchus minor]|uniref:Osiris 20 n=1 Tax=Molorchus minor TaxID=1323400 RepID=A0ABQ9IZJ8_9CUCU|nr:hypothetical protein NQ317_013078 [Molorchus minor]
MWKYTFAVIATVVYANSQQVKLTSGEDLVSTVLNRCVDINCVKQNVLRYLDNLLNIQSDVRNLKSVDAVIFERLGKILKTHEIRFKLPESLVQHTDIVYNPRFGLDVISPLVKDETRGLGLKKKLLFPILLLLKLKLKLLMPLFVAIIGIKAAKALILSKLAIVIVIGFLIYQILGKAGMPMPLSMTATATDSPSSMYGVPGPSTAPPSSYEPGWESAQGGPYQRIWSTYSNDPQSLSYSAYQPAIPASSTVDFQLLRHYGDLSKQNINEGPVYTVYIAKDQCHEDISENKVLPEISERSTTERMIPILYRIRENKENITNSRADEISLMYLGLNIFKAGNNWNKVFVGLYQIYQGDEDPKRCVELLVDDHY